MEAYYALLESLPVEPLMAFITVFVFKINGYFVPNGCLRVIPHIYTHLTSSTVRVGSITNIYISIASEITGILVAPRRLAMLAIV